MIYSKEKEAQLFERVKEITKAIEKNTLAYQAATSKEQITKLDEEYINLSLESFNIWQWIIDNKPVENKEDQMSKERITIINNEAKKNFFAGFGKQVLN